MRMLLDGRCLVQSHLGGVQQYARALLGEFSRFGLPFDVAKPSSTNRLAQHVWEHFVLPGLARGFDVLFCPGNVAPFRLPSRTKLVATVHCLRFLYVPQAYRWPFRRYYRFMIPRVLRRADAVITVSRTQADQMVDRFPHVAGKLHVVPLGVSGAFRPADRPRKDPIILFVGDLGAGKNLSRLLQAFARLADRLPHTLWIAGEAPPIFRSGLCGPEGLRPDRVRWLGQIHSPAELADLYRKAQLLVFPSLYESFGLPPLEAMACGTAVVAGDVPALHETIGKAGLFVDPLNVDAIADGILTVLTDDALRARLEREGPRRAQDFTWERCARATWEVLRDVAR